MKKSLLITGVAMLVFGTLLTSPAQADYLYDRSGTLISIDGTVLGDDDTGEEMENETESGSDDSVTTTPAPSPNRSELDIKREEQKREQDKKKLEREIEARKKSNEKNEIKSQLEIRSEDGKFKLKQEIRDKNGRVTKKEVELKEGESLHVENEQGERTEIKPMIMELKEEQKEARADNREQRLELIKEKVKARTDFSLTVDEDNKLIVTKPDGSSRVVTILPDEAVAKFQEKGILVEGITPELTENEAGEAVYRVTQEEERRILGFALKFKRENEVSAETGEVVTTSLETNPVKKWLERFVF